MVRTKTAARIVCILLIGAAICIQPLSGGRAGAEEPEAALELALSESRELLQKSLTIFEIDRELQRLAVKEAEVAAKIEEVHEDIARQELMVKERREHAGKVLNAYYMGERQSIWLAVFSVRSLTDALMLYEYIHTIIENDQRLLHNHQKAAEELNGLKNSLMAAAEELTELKDEFLLQRSRLTALQDEVDAGLQASQEAAHLAAQMKELADNWEKEGLPAFLMYFNALSEAMGHLPELLAGENNLIIRGFNYTFQIADEELNSFLQGKNELFASFAFHFHPDQVVAAGRHGEVEATIKGNYHLQQETNQIRFRVDELIYNGYQLPDTTMRSLEAVADLVIDVEKHVPFLVATGVQTEAGRLSVHLRLQLR